jgi:methionyl-tRNA synthetase
MQKAHERDFAGFDIEFDNYGSTHSEENRSSARNLAVAARERGWSSRKREVEQLYDPEAGHVPGRPLRQGDLPEVQGPRPIRRQLRRAARPTARPI